MTSARDTIKGVVMDLALVLDFSTSFMGFNIMREIDRYPDEKLELAVRMARARLCTS